MGEQGVERFGVSMPAGLLADFDRLIRRRGYGNRSQAIRDLVREHLVAHEWEGGQGQVVGTVTLVYDHELPDLAHQLADLQHQGQGAVICSTHVHLDQHNCLEVVVLRGLVPQVRAIADRLIATRGVKHGKLICSTTGRRLA